MFFSVSLSIVNERSPLSTCSSLTRLSTVTFSSIPPMLSAMSPVEARSFALTTTLVRSAVLKPDNVTLST